LVLTPFFLRIVGTLAIRGNPVESITAKI